MSFLRFPFLLYKCGNVSIVKFSVNLVFQLAYFCCSFHLFQFRTASLQRLQVITLKDYHLKVRLVLVRRPKRMKDSSRRPLWLCSSKSRKELPKAGQTGFLLGITESLVGIILPYRPAFVTLYGKFTS